MIIAVIISIRAIAKKKPEKVRASMGFEPVTFANTSAMLYQLSYKATHWDLAGTCIRHKESQCFVPALGTLSSLGLQIF